jgi:hypothetical protein
MHIDSCDDAVSGPQAAIARVQSLLPNRKVRSSCPGRIKNSLFISSGEAGCGAHPASYPAGAGGSLPGGKAAEALSLPLTSN